MTKDENVVTEIGNERQIDNGMMYSMTVAGERDTYRRCPESADTVAKVENRTTPKISRKPIFRLPCRCNAL